MKTTNYVIYRSNSSWLDTFLGTEKNSLKHAAKIHGGQSELPEERYLNINQSTKQVIFLSKNQPVIRNWMRVQIYVLVNSIPVPISAYIWPL